MGSATPDHDCARWAGRGTQIQGPLPGGPPPGGPPPGGPPPGGPPPGGPPPGGGPAPGTVTGTITRLVLPMTSSQDTSTQYRRSAAPSRSALRLSESSETMS
ncbi:MAG: hypothetical protein GWP91_10185 [Rhodobacterales bacterium]|nr:hypothetical protein [Rhodobacterales bacterium]